MLVINMQKNICLEGSYPVHKGHAVHKCTKRNLAVHFPSNGRRKYADEPSRSLRSLPSLFCEKPPAPSCRWIENGRPDFVLCICARRDPCALDTIPSKASGRLSLRCSPGSNLSPSAARSLSCYRATPVCSRCCPHLGWPPLSKLYLLVACFPRSHGAEEESNF
jgi:hypothetical protein